MPLTEMEPVVVEERDKNLKKKKKESESRNLQKITDHFKTPEKDVPVVSKQRSLLQFFSKSPASVVSKTVVQEKALEEKENSISCDNLVFPKWSANITDKNCSLPKDVSAGKSTQDKCRGELNFSSKGDRSSEKKTDNFDNSDSVILLSDLSSGAVDIEQSCAGDSEKDMVKSTKKINVENDKKEKVEKNKKENEKKSVKLKAENSKSIKDENREEVENWEHVEEYKTQIQETDTTNSCHDQKSSESKKAQIHKHNTSEKSIKHKSTEEKKEEEKSVDTDLDLETGLPVTETAQESEDNNEKNIDTSEENSNSNEIVKNKDSSVKAVKKNTLKGSEMMNLLKEIKSSEKHEKKKKHKHKERLRTKEEKQARTDENSDKIKKSADEKDGVKKIDESFPSTEAEVSEHTLKVLKHSAVSNTKGSDKEKLKRKSKRKNGIVKAETRCEKDTVTSISYKEFIENFEDKHEANNQEATKVNNKIESEKEKKVREISYTEYLQSLENESGDDEKTKNDGNNQKPNKFTKLIDYEEGKTHEDEEEVIAVEDGKIKCESASSKGIAKFFTKTSTPAKLKEKTSKTKHVKAKQENKCLPKAKANLKSNEKGLHPSVQESKACENSEDGAELVNEVDEGIVSVRSNFLKNSDKTVFPDKKKQATLSFGSSGLTMSKQAANKAEVSHDDETKVVEPQKRGQRKSKNEGMRTNEIEKINLDTTSESVFETPARGRKRKKEEDSTDLEGSILSPESTGERRRSSRKKYKVTAFQMDTNQRTPIKLKLKRCGKSSSSGDEELANLKAMQKQIKMKLTKAQALLEKARKGQRKPKASLSVKIEEKNKSEKKRTKAKTKLENLDADSTRRSSRLVGKCQPSMEEVSLDNIVISSDDEKESGSVMVRKRGRPKGSVKNIGGSKKELNSDISKKESTARKEMLKADTPKKSRSKTDSPKKLGTPKKAATSTATPKKGKLAPLFMMGKAKAQQASPAKPPLDPEQARQRQAFLMSGVPEELRKQTATRLAAIVEADYPPLPEVNHIQQIPDDTSSDKSWSLSRMELKLRPFVCYDSLSPVSTFSSVEANQCTMQADLDWFKEFHGHAKIEEALMEECLNEVASFNPAYPVHKVYQVLQNQTVVNIDNKPEQKDIDEVIMIEEETVPKKRGRKSLKLQKKVEEKEKEDMVTKKSSDTVKGSDSSQSLWTEKYCPTKSSEILGNSTILKKLKNWLSEWKQLLDREARKARKLLMKKNKGKLVSKAAEKDDMWDDDSDFDLFSDDSDDDTSLCNTMLLMGPHGCGKTCSVYALAQELGFKVHEVNASSSRNGRHILSQLKEATQSHQVASSHGCSTPTKKPAAIVPEKPNAKMSTNFASFFKKAADDKPEINSKERKRKRKSDIEEKPERKRRKREEELKKPSVLDDTSQGLTQALNLTSTTLILFDEVDVFFEEDKGFLSAIQTFMSTTKIPIILTTSDPGFTSMFEGRYEQIVLRRPPVRSIVSRLQTIALLENLRIDIDKLSELIQFYNKDVRKCLVSLQFLLDSGGSDLQVHRVIQKLVMGSRPMPVIPEDSQDCSQQSGLGCQSEINGAKGTEFDEDDDDFVVVKPVAAKRKRILEDDSSASMDAFSDMFLQKRGDVGSAGTENDTEAKKYPPVHTVGVETYLGIRMESKKGTLDSLGNFLKGHCRNPSRVVEMYRVLRQSLNSSIIHTNLPILLPLAVKVVNSVAKVPQNNGSNNVTPKRKRIKNDLYDSEASNDASDLDKPSSTDTDKPELENMEEGDVDTKTGNKEEGLCLARALSKFATFYDTMSSLDVLQTGTSGQSMDRLQGAGGRDLSGRLVSGMETCLPKHYISTSLDMEDVLDFSVEIETRTTCNMYKEIEAVQTQVEELCVNNPAFSEEFVLPVMKGNESFRLSDSDGINRPVDLSRACDNVQDSLPLVAYKNRSNLHMDYMPTLREISRFEQCRQLTNTKRRFQHYFDNVNFSVKDRTIGVLSTAFL